ncbi:hypothetical protein [Bradyrhizobium sp. McL0616]|uniref:hypothetical protein n=1 Tax=Bradyrhizobium sp. McL0616 TaxID=3415674 RepID=UPI003CF21103
MPTLEETLANQMQRFADVASLKHVQSAFKVTLDAHKTLKKEAAEMVKKVAADNRLTPVGRREKMQEYVGKESHRVLRAQRTLAKIREQHEAQRVAIQPRAADRTDLVGAVARSDLRSMLRGMPIGKSMQLLLAPDADPILLAAVLELPNYASGINDETRRAVTERVIEREHPGALAALERDAEAVELLGVVTRVLEDTARDIGEFPNAKLLQAFVEQSVGDTSRLDADIQHSLQAA